MLFDLGIAFLRLTTGNRTYIPYTFLLNFFSLTRLTAVSYTHLDVYKRQIQEEGRIVINITVDPKGNVIFAEVGRGTNIDNASMRKSALDAARKAKFNSISGANNQSGTITYVYKFK